MVRRHQLHARRAVAPGRIAPDDLSDVDDPVRADTAGSQLAAPVTRTETKLRVDTTTGPPWIDADDYADEFPSSSQWAARSCAPPTSRATATSRPSPSSAASAASASHTTMATPVHLAHRMIAVL